MERKKRIPVLKGCTINEKTGCGNLYIVVNELEGEPFEIFAKLGKAGGCASAQCESLGRAISVGLQFGVPIEEYVSTFTGIKCSETPKGTPKYACADAIAKALEKYLEGRKEGKISKDEEKDKKV